MLLQTLLLHVGEVQGGAKQAAPNWEQLGPELVTVSPGEVLDMQVQKCFYTLNLLSDLQGPGLQFLASLSWQILGRGQYSPKTLDFMGTLLYLFFPGFPEPRPMVLRWVNCVGTGPGSHIEHLDTPDNQSLNDYLPHSLSHLLLRWRHRLPELVS